MKSKSRLQALGFEANTLLNTVGAVTASVQVTPPGTLPDGTYLLEVHASLTRNPTAGVFAAAKSGTFELIQAIDVRAGVAKLCGTATGIVASNLGADYATATLALSVGAGTIVDAVGTGVAAEDINWRVWASVHSPPA